MTHDKFCMDHGLIGLATADCTCKEIAAIRADEREQAAERIGLTLFYKLLDSTSQRGISAAARGEDIDRKCKHNSVTCGCENPVCYVPDRSAARGGEQA